MRTEKLPLYRIMMGDPCCTGVCFVILLVAAAQGAAQAGESLRTADGTDEQPPPFWETKPLDRKMMSGKKWKVGEHSYFIDEGSRGERQRVGPVNGHLREGEEWRGEATHEGPRHLFKEAVAGLEEKQGSGASGDEWASSIHMNSPGEEDKTSVLDLQPPLVYGDESAVWSREADLWKYQEGQWKEVRLPDHTYRSLPTPDPPAAALVVDTIDKVEIERRLEGLKNVTIHCRFYVSDSHILPELEVFLVTDGSRQKLWVDTTTGVWKEQTIHVPEADNSSIIIEGWLKTKGNIIALSNLYTEGVTSSRDEALDVDSDQMTLTGNTMENITSTLATEGLWEGAADQDNTTRSSITDETQIKTSQSPAEGNTEEGTETAMPSDEFGFDPSTDISESAEQTTEQVYGITDVATLNSSMSGDDNLTSNGDAPDDFNATVTTTNTENNETNEGENSFTASVTTGQLNSSQNGTEDAFETSGKADNSTTLSIPGSTTDSLQTIVSVTLAHSNASATDGPLITETSINSESPSIIPTDTRFTDGQNLSTNVFKTTMGSSNTVLGTPYPNTTSEYVTVGKEFPGGVTKVPTPPPAGNTTEAVVAVPVSSTSWQVFQIFLVLCVLGLLALGFLYWKRKRRQDDEIPVFTRHTDYPNPTFTMEDAANFMSRVGRNTYKSID